MDKCLELANQAKGLTSPNPMVGCVIINDNNEIISTGYHKKYGENHAERDALSKLDSAQGCTLVVNLEPCSHYGKTPPCTDIIIEKGIKRVVYGMKDPNPVVAGRGLKKLQDAGIEVIGPVLEEKCKKLNEIFITNHEKKRIFVALKTATTIDGKIATCNGDSKWITSSKARNEVKKIRTYYDAILTSSSTVIADNPTMLHNNKIILDRNLKTDINSDIYKQGKVYVFHDERLEAPKSSENVNFIKCPVTDNKLDIKHVLETCYSIGITSVFVEAGGILNESCLPYVDKLYHFIAPKILGDNSGKSAFDGYKAEKISQCRELEFEDFAFFEPDIMVIYGNKNNVL